jgi:uncharacterized membrane protein
MFQWFPPRPAETRPAVLSLDERKVQARQEALKYLSDPDLDSTNLTAILRAKHNISPEDAAQAVQEAQTAIAEGNSEEGHVL